MKGRKKLFSMSSVLFNIIRLHVLSCFFSINLMEKHILINNSSFIIQFFVLFYSFWHFCWVSTPFFLNCYVLFILQKKMIWHEKLTHLKFKSLLMQNININDQLMTQSQWKQLSKHNFWHWDWEWIMWIFHVKMSYQMSTEGN